MLTADELEQMFRDTGGVPVSLGGASTYGHFDIMDEVALSEAEILVAAPTLVVPTGKLPGLKVDEPILVNQEAWFVRDHRRIDDGSATRILLRR